MTVTFCFASRMQLPTLSATVCQPVAGQNLRQPSHNDCSLGNIDPGAKAREATVALQFLRQSHHRSLFLNEPKVKKPPQWRTDRQATPADRPASMAVLADSQIVSTVTAGMAVCLTN
eukprot:INCI8415.1.p1 GENE.INCI8415.1~~INCI8415.1.p1  ORF type:complete len:117 (+),score=17.65 INCI8415.1:70-420(+)